MSHSSTCSYRRLNPASRVFVPMVQKPQSPPDRDSYPASDISSLDEEIVDAITAVGNNDDPPIWWLRAQSPPPANTVVTHLSLPSKRTQLPSPLCHSVMSPVDPEICTTGQSNGSGRGNHDVSHAPPTSSASVNALSISSAAHATSTTSAPVLTGSSISVTAAKTPTAPSGKAENSPQSAAQSTPNKVFYASQTKSTDDCQDDVFSEKCEHGSDGGASESGWTTASGGMAFSFSFPDGKPLGQQIFKMNGIPVISFIPLHMRPPVKSPSSEIKSKASLVNKKTSPSEREVPSVSEISEDKIAGVIVTEEKVEDPVQSFPMISHQNTKPVSELLAAEKQRTFCEKYNSQVETMFSGMSSKYPQPTSTRAVKEARQAESEAKKAEMMAARASPPRYVEVGTKCQVSTPEAKKVPMGRVNQHKIIESGIPPNWAECEPDPSTRPNSTNGWINWKPKPKTGPASARSGHMTMSEYQAAIAYRPQGADCDYEAIKARAAAKRFSGPEYQYYGEKSNKKRRPKHSPRKAVPQQSTLPPMFPDVLPWREVVPQPPNTTGKKMPELDFCGQPMEKGRGFDGTIKHWGVPTRNQDHVPFIEINAIASDYTTDCDKDTDDPTRKSVRRFPPPKACSVSKYTTYAQIKADYRKDKAATRLKKREEKMKALEQPAPLPRLIGSVFEKNGFTLRERIGTFLRSLNPDFPDPPDMLYESQETEPTVPCAQQAQGGDDSGAKEIIINCVEDELEKPRREPHIEPIRGRADMEWYRTHDGCWSQRFPVQKKSLPPLTPNEPTIDW